jgi:hypothetical protein
MNPWIWIARKAMKRSKQQSAMSLSVGILCSVKAKRERLPTPSFSFPALVCRPTAFGLNNPAGVGDETHGRTRANSWRKKTRFFWPSQKNRVSDFYRTGLGRLAAAANRGAVEAHEAAAAVLEAAGQGVAAGLQDVAAGFVAAGASDAAAVLGQFALAVAAAEVDLTAGDAVLRTAHAAQARRKGAAEVLQRGTSDVIIAGAVQL